VKLYIVRHGEPAAVEGLDRPLSDLGRRQAQATGAFLVGARPTALYVSPFRRTVETAREVCSVLGLRAEVRPRLSEFFVPEGMKNFRGMTVSAMRSEFQFLEFPAEMPEDQWWPRWPETDADVDRRVAGEVADIFAQWGTSQRAVVLVGHGASCKSALRAALSADQWPGEDVGHDHCGISLIQGSRPGSCALLFQNQTSHLPHGEEPAS